MLESTFLQYFRQAGAARLNKTYALFKKPLELWNIETNETIEFEDIEEAFAHIIDGKSIKDIVADASVDMFKLQLDGGRGSGSSGNENSFKFGHAKRSGSGKDKKDFPARMNVTTKTKNPQAALQTFRNKHANDDYESGVTVDENGYITSYVHGDATSVGIWGKKGEMVYHNHPGGGNFSDSDLLNTAMTPAKGIVASGSKGDYSFTKGQHFNAAGFSKAVKSATLKGKDYDSAADKWLKQNQKKYGYTYSFTKAK